MENRYLTHQIERDLTKKMVFLGGPRQVGKTTLAKGFLEKAGGSYINWDTDQGREAILTRIFPESNFYIFDEIHKYKRWRNFLKGLYDTYGKEKRILVTGSARLDVYRHSGDSLQGRYHYLRLHPLTIAELSIESQTDFDLLLSLSGFPEPFFSGSVDEGRRWAREYRQRLIREDVRDLENLRDLTTLEEVALLLPKLVGSPLSVNSLRENFQVAHKTMTRWLEVLENLYYIYLVPPFQTKKLRSVSVEKKHYHFNWALCPDEAARFENLVAGHLLKFVHFQQDTKGKDVELNYFRNDKGREVDFVLVEDSKPILAIECKLTDTSIHQPLEYFKAEFPKCECVQLVAIQGVDLIRNNIRVVSALKYLKDFV